MATTSSYPGLLGDQSSSKLTTISPETNLYSVWGTIDLKNTNFIDINRDMSGTYSRLFHILSNNSQLQKWSPFVKTWFQRMEIEMMLESQIEKFKEYYLDEEILSLKNTFYLNLDWILELSLQVQNLQISESPSIFFKLDNYKDYSLHLEIFVDTQEVAYSLYRDKALISQKITNVGNALKSIQDEFGTIYQERTRDIVQVSEELYYQEEEISTI